MSEGSENRDTWDLSLADLSGRAGTPACWPAVTAAVAALLGLQTIMDRLRASAEQVGTPIGENPFGPLVESALRLDGELAGHVEALRIVAADLAAADGGAEAAPAVLQAAIEMPLNVAQTCVEALALAQRAAGLADAEAMPAILGGAELLAAAARTMLHLVAPSIRRLSDPALAAEYRQSVDHFGPALHDRYRKVEDLARRRAS